MEINGQYEILNKYKNSIKIFKNIDVKQNTDMHISQHNRHGHLLKAKYTI